MNPVELMILKGQGGEIGRTFDLMLTIRRNRSVKWTVQNRQRNDRELWKWTVQECGRSSPAPNRPLLPLTVHFRVHPFLKCWRNIHEIHSMNIHSIDQWETQIKGYPIRIDTRLQSRAWDDCPPLEKGPNVKEIKCNKSSCVMKCMPGFVKVSFSANFRLCVGNSYAFFWNKYFWESILSL